jgi:teichuronic acid exporter
MSVERDAVAGLKWGSIAKVVGQIVSWAATLAVLRLLSPEDYGLMALSMVVVAVFAGFAEFGLGFSLVQSASIDGKELPRVAGAIFAFNIGAGLVILLGAPVLAVLLGDSRLTPLLQVLSVQFVFTAIDTVPYSLAYRSMRFKRLAGVELAVTLLGAFATLLLAWGGAGVWALVFGNLLAAGMRATLYVYYGGFVRPSFDIRGIGPHVRFGGVMTLTRVIWQLTSQADLLIAGRLFASSLVGAYSVSAHLATMPMAKVMGVVNQVAFPAVARLQDDFARLRPQFLRSMRLLAAAAIPALWGLSCIAPEFVDVVLGEQWEPATVPLQVLSFVTPLRILQALFATALQGVGRADLELRNTIVGAIVLPISFLVGAQGGLNGLALSWLFAIPLVVALNLPRTLRVFGFGLIELAAAFRAPLIAGAAMYGVVNGARALLDGVEEWSRLLILVAAGGGVYLAVVRVVDQALWVDVRRLATALRG